MNAKPCFWAALSAFVLCVSTNAQLPTGSIDGIATDPNGRLVQGAHITVTSKSQGTVRESASNADGSFTLPNLAPGSYTIVLSFTGFAEVRYANVQVEPGKAVTLDTRFNIATQTSSVDVHATSQDIDLTQSMLQGQITSGTITNIPLNGRNFLELAFLIPGNRPAPIFDPPRRTRSKSARPAGLGVVATSRWMEATTMTKW